MKREMGGVLASRRVGKIGKMAMLCILTEVLVTWVYTFIKIHQTTLSIHKPDFLKFYH